MITIPITIDQALELCRDPDIEIELVAEAPGIALTLYVATRLQQPIGDTPEGADPPPTLRPSGPAEDEQAAGGNVCPHCGRPFASPNGLSIHIGRAHGGKPAAKAKATRAPGERSQQAPTAGTFECSDCGEKFDSAQKRGGHRRIKHPNPLTVVPEAPATSVLAEVPFERKPFDPDTVRAQQAASGPR